MTETMLTLTALQFTDENGRPLTRGILIREDTEDLAAALGSGTVQMGCLMRGCAAPAGRFSARMEGTEPLTAVFTGDRFLLAEEQKAAGFFQKLLRAAGR